LFVRCLRRVNIRRRGKEPNSIVKTTFDLKPLPRTAASIAKLETRNNQKPNNERGSNAMKTQTQETVMKPSTPNTDLQSSTQLHKVVSGSSRMNRPPLYTAAAFCTYPTGTVVDPQGAVTGSLRVIRGGDWYDGASDCRSAFRGGDGPGSSSSGIGFRIVLTAGQ
jgi:formylglycine-generating enzyme required for sulfatase activity